MYTESIGSRKSLGDVDILYHEGIYHLFHLVLPNHDFIAHAVSNDCFHWRRVENALFIGNPGAWDDSMLWTMHVSKHPFADGKWRMFYTGLSRRDQGRKQRIGMAVSDDLYIWKKTPVSWIDRRSDLPYELPGRPKQPAYEYDSKSCFPLSPDPLYYEASADEGRHWVSWRDPFYYRENDRGWLLCSGRVNDGPFVRRGCVAVMEETRENGFSARPPLHHPGLYDDIEVPNLLKIGDDYYLIGSIREDAKIRYWHTDDITSPWRSYHDNVLLAAGNYAGRICEDDAGFLLWNFYNQDEFDRGDQNLMPPPKRLFRRDNGQLRVKSFEGFDKRVDETLNTSRVCPLKRERDGDHCLTGNGSLKLSSESGFQAYLFNDDVDCFRLSVLLDVAGCGKCGLVFRTNRVTHDGYYLSLDLAKGVAQLRAWGTGDEGTGESMMQFHSLQSGFWASTVRNQADITLIVHGSYIELTIDGRVVLSLADQRFTRGAVGIYVESTELEAIHPVLERLKSPLQSDEHLANG
jgi:beta-fructofuranosidase